tara:strand:+ start:788 stop:1462 length:675 start_codon:yes stop_codon:yes gene_type:complete
MNFFKNKLTGKKYSKLLKFGFSNKFILENSGLLAGNKAFYRQMKIFEIIKKTHKVKGDIIEFGIWNGNNLITIKKILDYLRINKKVFGYDNFKGFPNPSKLKNQKKGKYIGNPNTIKKIISFFKLKNIEIFNDDIMSLIKYKKKFKKISFIYIDCNIYTPVKNILDQLGKKVAKGGIVAFDEAQHETDKGERMAMLNFYKKNKKNFTLKYLKKNYQPDALLIRK